MATVADGNKVPPIYVDPHIPSKLELCGAGKAVSITPSNTVNPTKTIKGFIAETAGDIAVVNFDNTVEVITVVAGQTVPLMVKRINATGTTATGMTIV